jgi:hypothetical protein
LNAGDKRESAAFIAHLESDFMMSPGKKKVNSRKTLASRDATTPAQSPTATPRPSGLNPHFGLDVAGDGSAVIASAPINPSACIAAALPEPPRAR